VSLEKDFQSFEFKSTCFNFQLPYQSARRKHLLFKPLLSSHKNVHTWLTSCPIGLTKSYKSQLVKSISTLRIYCTNEALIMTPQSVWGYLTPILTRNSPPLIDW